MGITHACQYVGISKSTYYRSQCAQKVHTRENRNARRLSSTKRAEILDVLNSEQFMDLPPRQIWARLLDEGRYLCHWRTMYRILQDNRLVQERRNQRIHPSYAKPELLATQPPINCGVGISPH